MFWTILAASAACAYFIGSFPSGYFAGRACGKDLQKEGSGNIGATNAFRVLGKTWGYVVFAADALKGWLAVTVAMFLARHYGMPGTLNGVVAAAFAVLGHNFPVWLGFKGGKGISTSAGIMIALYPIWVFLSGLFGWLILFFSTRYVSAGSIAAAIALPTSSAVLMYFGQTDWLQTAVAVILCVLALWRHRENIQRLRAGTEKKFEKKPRTPVD